MKMEIYVKNEDMDDIFVWVRDNLDRGQELVLDGVRLNPGERIGVEVEKDEDGDGLITWLAQKAHDSSVQKQEGPLSVDEGEEVDVDLFGATRASNVVSISNIKPFTVQDPRAFEILDGFVQKHFSNYPDKIRNVSVAVIHSLSIEWGELTADVEAGKTLPDVVELDEFTWVNEQDKEKERDEFISVTTSRSVTFQSGQDFETTNEFKMGIKIPVGSSALNSDLVQKTVFKVNSSESQTVKDEKKVDTRYKYVVPPKSILKIHALTKKGRFIVPVKGEVVIEAIFQIQAEIKLIANSWSRLDIIPQHLTLSRAYPRPHDRLIEYSGTLISDTFKDTKITERVVPLPQSEEERAIYEILERGGWVSSG